MKSTTRKKQSYRFILMGFFSSVPLSVFLGATPARAQVGLEDEMSNESADRARVKQAEISDYTIKSGDMRMLLTPALSLQFNDNIYTTEHGQKYDFIVLPTVGMLMSYPLTQENLLQINLTGGYSKYCVHPQLSSWYLSAGSGISFDVFIKDILINLHDQFSYVQNAAGNAAVSGTGTYGIFQNTAGLSVKWDLKNVGFTVGYDHQNSIASSAQFSDTDSSTESGYARVGYNINSKLTTGVEGSAAYTGYNQNTLNNNEAYSAGVYADWHPDAFLHVEPRVGYSINQYQQSSQQLQTSDLYSWYVDLVVSHQITQSLNYSIDAGHNVSPGVQSDNNQIWYVNTGISWNFIKNFSFQPQLFYQYGTQGQGSTLTALGMANTSLVPTEDYSWYGGSIGFNYNITKRFTMSWNYQFTQRTSNSRVPNRKYIQNVIGIQITYHTI